MLKRYIVLSSEDVTLLKAIKKASESERIRDRSHALLLSNKGHDVLSLSEIFEVRQATILDWFNRWETGRELKDRYKVGRPRRFTDEEGKK